MSFCEKCVYTFFSIIHRAKCHLMSALSVDLCFFCCPVYVLFPHPTLHASSDPRERDTLSPPCMTEADRFSLEALQHIHREMDDDQDGGIEVEESVEFIIEDMQQQQQANKHSKLHHEDQHITLEELWKGWKSSEVHNWTQEDVLRWLREFDELAQYEKGFKELRVNGNTLPRIAANEPSFMSTFLKIQDQQHKQKLKLKALDVVLFGPPTRPPHNWMKDLVLIVSVVMGVGGCWFARVQNKVSKVHITKMMKDLESLQRAEQSLRDLQEQLEKAQEEKRTVAVEKKNLEEKMRDEIQGAQEEANRLHKLRDGAVSELTRLWYAEEELGQVRDALKRAEKDMQSFWSVPETLQLWLQLTHEVEVQYYNVKKHSAVQQLVTAKDEAEKIKKKRSSLLGTLYVAHSSSLDQVDQRILEAKNALAEVTACLRERLHRWQQIESLCGFPVMKNTGLPSLTASLYPDPNWMLMPRAAIQSYQMPVSVEDMEEEMPQIIPQIPGWYFSVESSKHLKMLGKTYSSKDIPSRMMAQDDFDVSTDFERQKIRDISMDTASKNILKEEFERSKSFKENREIPSKKISRDEQDIVMEMQRIQRKIDSSVETPTGKIQREMVGLSVEAPRCKIPQEEFLVTNPGQLGPPDLTVCSLMLWKSASDSLSTLVYDGILEKSYGNPLMPSPDDLSHAASVSCSSQSLLGNEGQSANVSTSEFGGKDKGKTSSKLKNIFKKKKDLEKYKDS
uniref:Stromal interaction molecule 2 n=1 Tax=Sinocyclocheilus grahami TaxID=75366 RepID=A0A672LTN7_SINGR